MVRNGFTDTDSPGMTYVIDDLSYTYKTDSNQLQAVHDETNSTDGFKDGNQSSKDFYYDDYGNMIQDLNKKITAIKYNHLNLPTQIKFNADGANEIIYLYNAVGVKVGKKIRSTTPQTGTVENKTDYLNGFQYVDGNLQFFPTAEGYVSVTYGNKFNYVYNYTDHLGNIRVSYSFDQGGQQLKILEENHYYPFGLKHSNYNEDRVQFEHDDVGIFAVLRPVEKGKYQYKYNGKEYQDELGLNTYDYGFRQYMPDIGRFGNIDPLAELAYDLTPNRYCFNNPLRFTDPTGLWETTAGGYTTNDPEDIKRFMSYLDVEKYSLNNSPTNSQMASFIGGEMSPGGHGKTSDGSVLADEIEVTRFKRNNGNFEMVANKDSFDNFWHGVQRSLTPDALDPRTIGHNVFWTTYSGPWNPKKYSGKDDYSLVPQRPEDIPSLFHDLTYNDLKIEGAGGLFTAKSAIAADYRFVAQQLAISITSNNIRTKFTAGALGVGLGLFALPKTVYSTVTDTYLKAHPTTTTLYKN